MKRGERDSFRVSSPKRWRQVPLAQGRGGRKGNRGQLDRVHWCQVTMAPWPIASGCKSSQAPPLARAPHIRGHQSSQSRPLLSVRKRNQQIISPFETVSLIHYPLHTSLTFCSQDLFSNKENKNCRTPQSESHTLASEVVSLLRIPSRFPSLS